MSSKRYYLMRFAKMQAIACVLGLVVALAVNFVYQNKAFGDDHARMLPGVCAPSPTEPCGYPTQMVAKFKAGKLGNSRGAMLPPRVIRMINVAAGVSRAQVRAGSCNWCWWQIPGNALDCMARALLAPTCEKTTDQLDNMTTNTTKVVILCGGAAVFGALRGGGYWGAGVGASACLWAYVWNAIFGVLPGLNRTAVDT